MTVASYTLDAHSAAGAAGDALCKVNATTVTRAVAAALALYPVVGLLTVAANPGTLASTLLDGFAPPSLTLLAATAGKCRVNTTTARPERVASLSGSDYPLGDIDAYGYLELQVDPISVGTRAEVQALTTPRHNAYVYCAEASGPYRFDATSAAVANGTTVLAATDGSRGAWVYATFTADSAEAVIAPGTARAATINAALAAGTTVRLQEGTYQLESAIVVPTGKRLVGAGQLRTILQPTFTPLVGLADTATNALVLAQGTVATSPVNTTTVAAVANLPGVDVLRVTSATGIAAGAYLAIGPGNNVPGNPNDSLDMSDGTSILLTEVVQVASTYVSGTTIPLTAPLAQWHGPGQTVKSCTPVINAAISDLFIDCAGGSIANGITADYTPGLTIERVAVRGFSRAAVELRLGTTGFRVNDLLSRGECNSLILGDSCMRGDIGNVRCVADGKRYHANGIIRAQFTFYERCTSIRVHDFHLQRACGGLRTWGGWHIHYSDGVISDMDATEMYNRDASAVRGVGVDGGAAPLDVASFSYDETYSNVHCHDCFTTLVAGEPGHCGWFLHDARKFRITNCGVTNHGPLSGTVVNGVTYYAQGFRVNDCIGYMDSFYTSGCTYGFYTTGAGETYIGTFIFDPTAGNGSASVAMWLDNAGYASSPRIKHFRQAGGSGGIFLGANFTGNPDYKLRIDKFEIDDDVWTDVVLADHVDGNTYAAGDVVEFISGGTRRVATPGGTSAKNAVVASAPTSTLCFVAPTPATQTTVMCTAAAVAVGDYLEGDSARRGKTQATPAFTTFGRALTAKAGGSTGTVRVGPR